MHFPPAAQFYFLWFYLSNHSLLGRGVSCVTGHAVSSHKAAWKSKKLISPQRTSFNNQNAQLILKINSLATAYNNLTGSVSYSLSLSSFSHVFVLYKQRKLLQGNVSAVCLHYVVNWDIN